MYILLVECCELGTDIARNEQRGVPKILKRQAVGSFETSVFSSGHCFTFKKN